MARFAPLGAALGLVLLATGGAGAATFPSIYVNYSDSCVFTMSADGGFTLASTAAPGTVLPPGRYQIVLTTTKNAPSCPMDFRLSGPGVQLEWEFGNEAIDAMASETLLPSSTYTATDVKDGSRGYVVFSTSATGSSASLVTQAPSTAAGKGQTLPGVVGSSVAPYRGPLAATVSSTGRLTVTLRGRPVHTLAAGRYRVQVIDRSSRSGVAIATGSRRRAVSGIAYVGTKTATLAVAAGSSVVALR
jgi:hypothetical protein